MRRPGSWGGGHRDPPEDPAWRARRSVSGLLNSLVLWFVLAASPATVIAGDYSLLNQSTVVGRNTGVPAGAGVGTGLSATAIGDVDFVLESAFYFKNMELFGLEVAEGETLFGVLLPLRFRYRPAQGLSIELGAVVGEDYGDDTRLNVAEPLLRLVYSPGAVTYIVAGTLYPTHWIHDALLDDNQKLRGRAEQGLQLRVDGARFKEDLWINWRVRETEFRAEEFEIASSGQLRLFDDRLRLDLHAIWVHAGGQISLDDRLEHNLVFMFGGTWDAASVLTIGQLDALHLSGRLLYSSKSGRNVVRSDGLGWEIAVDSEFQLRPRLRARGTAAEPRVREPGRPDQRLSIGR